MKWTSGLSIILLWAWLAGDLLSLIFSFLIYSLVFWKLPQSNLLERVHWNFYILHIWRCLYYVLMLDWKIGQVQNSWLKIIFTHDFRCLLYCLLAFSIAIEKSDAILIPDLWMRTVLFDVFLSGSFWIFLGTA